MHTGRSGTASLENLLRNVQLAEQNLETAPAKFQFGQAVTASSASDLIQIQTKLPNIFKSFSRRSLVFMSPSLIESFPTKYWCPCYALTYKFRH